MGKDKTLIGIGEDLLALEELLIEAGGDVTDEEAEAAVTQWLEENAGNLREKLDGYANLIERHDGLQKTRKAEAEKRAQLARVSENVIKRLRDRLLWFLTEYPTTGMLPTGKSGLPKIDTDNHVISVANNGGKTPVSIRPGYDPGHIPNSPYVRVRYEWDTDAIRADLENGIKLDFASLGDRGKHVRIK